jgi:hypothetical protein
MYVKRKDVSTPCDEYNTRYPEWKRFVVVPGRRGCDNRRVDVQGWIVYPAVIVLRS